MSTSDLWEQFRAAGADDPEGWAMSEVSSNIPQLARFCFLRTLWPQQIDGWRTNTKWIDHSIHAAERDPKGYFADAGLAMKRLLALGATREELASIARMVAYDTAFGVVHRIDERVDWDYNQEKGYPGWTLMEVVPDHQSTGRSVDALHEDSTHGSIWTRGLSGVSAA